MTNERFRFASPTFTVGTLALLLIAACGDSSGAETDSSGSTTDASTTVATSTTSATTDGGTAVDTGTAGSTGIDPCADMHPAIVTDIDETLTLSDEEFIMQIQDGTYDPVEREGASEMVNAYAELGYDILYLTARSETISVMGTGESAREATERWLMEHDFPFDPESTQLVLSSSFVVGDTARMYKAEALMELQGMGWQFDYAYGNADSDIGAYEDAMIPKDVTFIIGELAGTEGTVAIDEEGYLMHNADHLPMVPAVCGAGT